MLESFIARKKAEDADSERQHQEWMRDFQAKKSQAARDLFPCLRPASRSDYIKWLRAYVEAGNEPTHYYDHPFDQWDNFYVAKRDFELIPLCGASAINIIVPEGVKCLGGSRGHINLYFYEGPAAKGTVPVFNDTVI